MKRVLSVLIILTLCVGMLAGISVAAEVVDSGTCGENVTWELDSEGTLTISGTGAMANYEKGADVPWYADDSTVKTVIVEDGVTAIGDYAFSFCDVLESVTIGKDVKSIGGYAFYYDPILTSVTVPGNVETIGESAFFDCQALETVKLGSGVTTIQWTAFYRCTALKSVTISSSMQEVWKSAFAECTALTDVYYTGSEADRETITVENYNEAFSDATWHYNYTGAPQVALSTVNGAQIRLNGNQGLRFISTIDKASVDAGSVVEYGTILIPSADVTDVSELVLDATLNGHKVAKVPAKNLYAVTEDTITFTAVITNIKEKHYNRAYTARAYAILDDGSVAYADTGASRDVYTIAGKVLENETLGDAETAYLTRVIRYVEGIDVAVNFTEPVEDAQVPLSITVEGYEATISWTKTGGSSHTGTFESGTDYTATIVLTAEEAFSPNDRATINGDSVTFMLSEDGKTMTMQKIFEFKDAGYSGIY